jgi:hypothetical protein
LIILLSQAVALVAEVTLETAVVVQVDLELQRVLR